MIKGSPRRSLHKDTPSHRMSLLCVGHDQLTLIIQSTPNISDDQRVILVHDEIAVLRELLADQDGIGRLIEEEQERWRQP